VPEHNHCIQVLLGVIALRQGERPAAQEAFAEAVAQADALLAHTAQYYDALDAKGLALCGLALCGQGDALPAAVGAYRAARAITQVTGTVGRAVRLLHALAQADPSGPELLAAARAAAGGE
jgi:hypothetical protein